MSPKLSESTKSLNTLAAILATAFLRIARARKAEQLSDQFLTPSSLAISETTPLSVTPGGLTPPEMEK